MIWLVLRHRPFSGFRAGPNHIRAGCSNGGRYKTMEKCIACGKDAKITFRALEVQTLHVRDLDREKRVQALGDFHDFAVCRECAQTKLDRELGVFREILGSLIRFGLVLAAGIVLLAVFFMRDRVFTMLGLAAVVCGLIGVISKTAEGRERSRQLKAMKGDKALLSAAWDVVKLHAPKKYQDSDLTYIPVTPDTRRMKNGDIMIEYKLLPEIAIKAYEMIHQKGSENQKRSDDQKGSEKEA